MARLTLQQKIEAFNSKPEAERLSIFASGRATVGDLFQADEESRSLVRYYVGRVRGRIVTDDAGNFKFDTYEAALACARDYIKTAQQQLENVLAATRSGADGLPQGARRD